MGRVRRLQCVRGRLLGRETEFDAVRERLARGRAGGCEVVLIEGEPGIGKTRFLAEVLTAAAGFRPFHADAEELERTRPFGPLADALGCRVSSADPLGSEIARLIDESAAEFRIVERFGELLERMAVEGPLLVAVDDFQWADPSTVTSLRFVARHLGDVSVTFVLAFRPIPRGDELERLVDTSIRDGALHTVLGALDDDAVAELVEGRWAIARRLVTDDTIPTSDRVAGALVVLYGQPLARIARLTSGDLRRRPDATTVLTLDGNPVPIHESLASPIEQLPARRRNGVTEQLEIPGCSPAITSAAPSPPTPSSGDFVPSGSNRDPCAMPPARNSPPRSHPPCLARSSASAPPPPPAGPPLPPATGPRMPPASPPIETGLGATDLSREEDLG